MSLGNERYHSGAVKPSAIEQEVYDGNLSVIRTTDIPSGLKMRIDYAGRTDGQPVYQGFAPSGLSENEDGWLIYKFTYDNNGNMTERNVYGARGGQDANWTNRTSYTYD